MITVKCPECHKRFRTKKEFAGKEGKCPACGQMFFLEPVNPNPDPSPNQNHNPDPYPTQNTDPNPAAIPVWKKPGKWFNDRVDEILARVEYDFHAIRMVTHLILCIGIFILVCAVISIPVFIIQRNPEYVLLSFLCIPAGIVVLAVSDLFGLLINIERNTRNSK